MRFPIIPRPLLILREQDGMSRGSASLDDVAASMLTRVDTQTEAGGEPLDEQKRKKTKEQSVEQSVSSEGKPTDADEPDQRQNGVSTDAGAGQEQDYDDEDDTVTGGNAESGDEEEDGDEGDGDLLDSIFNDADHEGDDEGDGDTIDTSKLGENAKFSVKVDGEDVEVTLGDLKRRYAGEAAIDKRIQAATEQRNAATKIHDETRELAALVLKSFGDNLFRRTVPAPTAELRATNYQQYLMQKELYENEGQALQKQQLELYNLMQGMDAHRAETQAQLRNEARERLHKMMPVFKDPVKGPKVEKILVDTALEIGYTMDDVRACTDPLMFKLMGLAARELARQKGQTVTQKKPKARALPKNGKNRDVMSNQQRRASDAARRAQKTGSLDDVAESMIVSSRG